MTKITKIAAAVLCSFAVSAISFAGELTVTGNAKATYNITSSDSLGGKSNNGKGIGIANEFTLGASGELDNGWTWNYAQDIDGATVQDDAQMTMATNFGTVGVFVSEGGISAKYGFDTSAYAPGSDYGATGGSGAHENGAAGAGYTYGEDIGGYNNFQYHLPAGVLPYSGAIKLAYAPTTGKNQNASSNATTAAPATGNGASAYQIYGSFAPVDGALVKGSYFAKEYDAATIESGYEATGVTGKYALGAFSVGLGRFYVIPADGNAVTTAGTNHVEMYTNDALSVGLVVNDNLSVSLMKENSDATQKANGTINSVTSISSQILSAQAAYTMGGMTVSLAQKQIDNFAYTQGRDQLETVVAVVMAF